MAAVAADVRVEGEDVENVAAAMVAGAVATCDAVSIEIWSERELWEGEGYIYQSCCQSRSHQSGC